MIKELLEEHCELNSTSNYFVGVDFAIGCSTTTSLQDKMASEKYCTICKKTCGHWANEHDLVFNEDER